MAITTHRGLRIAYDVTGSGPAVVLQHGLLSRRERWHANGFVAGLSKRFTVVTVDSLGHGESDKPADPSAYLRDARADQLAAVMDAVGAERAHLVGYSMGGWMATGFAVRHPRRLLSLAIGGWNPLGGRATAGVPFAKVLAGARAAAPELTAWITPEVEPAIAACWGALAEAAGDGAEEALAACPVPVLLWAGREDPVHDGMRELAARLPGATFRSVSGEHLGPMTVHAAESLAAVRALLGDA
jgi:pimeloyl-ACP methyl ester carboxylesterase